MKYYVSYVKETVNGVNELDLFSGTYSQCENFITDNVIDKAIGNDFYEIIDYVPQEF